MNEPTIPTSSPAGEPGISEGQGTKVFIEGDVPLRYHLVGLSETELQATLDRMAARLAMGRTLDWNDEPDAVPRRKDAGVVSNQELVEALTGMLNLRHFLGAFEGSDRYRLLDRMEHLLSAVKVPEQIPPRGLAHGVP